MCRLNVSPYRLDMKMYISRGGYWDVLVNIIDEKFTKLLICPYEEIYENIFIS